MLDAVVFAQKPSKLPAHTVQAAEVAAQPTAIALGACGMCFDAMPPEQDIICRAPT